MSSLIHPVIHPLFPSCFYQRAGFSNGLFVDMLAIEAERQQAEADRLADAQSVAAQLLAEPRRRLTIPSGPSR